MNSHLDTYYKKISVISFLIFIATAYFSNGFHHPDEHFQILEFCNYKLGNIPATELPWEYTAQVRPALPVFIPFVFFKLFGFIGITNPFTLAFILRLMIGLFAWTIIRKLSLFLLDHFKTENGKKLFFALCMLLWFMPYTSVRFSTENLGALTFLWAIYLLLKQKSLNENKQIINLMSVGILLGFVFYFRFQMGFTIFGLGLWLIFIDKMNWKNISFLIFGGLISLAICICIDFWFYGEWVLSPVNYFTANIVHDIASAWGVAPWWNYFYLFFLQGVPPISLVLLLFFFVGIFKKPKAIFVWCLIPFLIAHFMVGHKEMRFMFPMIFSFIYISAIGIDYFIQSGKYKKLGRGVFIFIFCINALLIVFRTVAPSQETVNYYKFLYNYSNDKKITVYSFEEDAYKLVGLNINFYRSPNVTCVVFKDNIEFSIFLETTKPESAILLERSIRSDNNYHGYQKESIYCLLPDFLLNFNMNDWQSRARVWNIYEVKKM